ncbi:DNA repair exonuclease SbcCD ATPase subunit [Achromobacter deleyi]|uniref:hypothetical protein n=1 Tax=Achromobacter deleyi TaxID=1353891 RepID=UPI0028652087|nr:hypothetical protein [Achromobacter deleyi]MDR6600255.1 DNA repair exonuclease SbcCD ATPase subunit [Achromobacter deleyi]
MQNLSHSNGVQHLDIGVRAIQRDYDALIRHLKANDVVAAQTTIRALKHNIDAMKSLSGFAKEAALATQGAIVCMIKGLIDLMTETESNIRSLTAQQDDVLANQSTLKKALEDKQKALDLVAAKIKKTKDELAEKEREKAAQRSSNIPIWKWLKRAFYAALDAINTAIEAIKKALNLAHDQQKTLERELADLAQDQAKLQAAMAKLKARNQALQAELDQLKPVKRSLVDLKKYMETQLVFFNDVANFYVLAANRCDSVNYGIADIDEIIVLLGDSNPVIDYFEDTRIERLSLLDAVIRFDQMVVSAYQALEAHPA